jgi:hypothetical protein
MPIFVCRSLAWKKLLHQHARAGAALAGDEGFIGKVDHREASVPGKPVIGGSDDNMRMLAHQALFDGNVRRRLSHDRDIEIIAAQRLSNVLALADLEHNIDLRMALRERSHRERHEILRRANRADGNTAAAAACDHVERLLAINQGRFRSVRAMTSRPASVSRIPSPVR